MLKSSVGEVTACEMRYSIRAQRGHSPLSFTGSDCRPGNGPEIALFEYLQPGLPIATGVLNLYSYRSQMYIYKEALSLGSKVFRRFRWYLSTNAFFISSNSSQLQLG